MNGPILRILLRVLAGFLIARGFPADLADMVQNDPDVFALAQSAMGAAIWAATEGYYWLAKRRGWAT